MSITSYLVIPQKTGNNTDVLQQASGVIETEISIHTGEYR